MATASRSRSPRTRSRQLPDALQMLKDDHARVTGMFSEFEKADSDTEKEEIAERICGELTLHAALEENVFYPAVRAAIEDTEIMNEADVEHAGAKELIAKIEASDASHQHFEALVTVLGEAIKHHVKEEEGEMFKQVKRADLDLDDLAEQMKAFKRDKGAEPD
jgi:hypothetical protein